MIPQFILRKLYKPKSMKNIEAGFEFVLENSLAHATITRINKIELDSIEIPLSQIELRGESSSIKAESLNEEMPMPLDKGKAVNIVLSIAQLTGGEHSIKVSVATKEFGELNFQIKDTV